VRDVTEGEVHRCRGGCMAVIVSARMGVRDVTEGVFIVAEAGAWQ
jgi:hypothetical protein